MALMINLSDTIQVYYSALLRKKDVAAFPRILFYENSYEIVKLTRLFFLGFQS